jgi:hypothetical protein
MDLPAIDQNICGAWTEQQLTFYNALPFYFMEGQAQYRKRWPTWSKILSGKVAWKPQMGDTMRTVVAEPTPILRQQAFPNLLNVSPLTDVVNYRERKLDSKPRWQDFVSPHFNFYPEFTDFMRHIDRTLENITKQISQFEEVFIRTNMFHRSPYIYVAGVGLVDAPTGEGNAAGTSGKTTAWLQAQMAALAGTADGYLTLETLFKALNEFEQTVGATPFDGSGTPGGDSSPLNERFCLVQSAESWNNFVNDPWTKENRPLNMNIVTDSFKGDLFGRIRSKLESTPMRYALDVDFSPSLPNPELIELNTDREDYQRTKPNPAYAKVVNAPVEVAFLVGGPNYDGIEVGPPPSEFTRDLSQGDAIKMSWNGKPYMNKNFLVPCLNGDGSVQYDANSFGRFLRLQATATVGVRAVNPQNILPIIFKRRVGITT